MKTINSGFATGTPRSENRKGVREGRETGVTGVTGMPAVLGVGRMGKAPAAVPVGLVRRSWRWREGKDRTMYIPGSLPVAQMKMPSYQIRERIEHLYKQPQMEAENGRDRRGEHEVSRRLVTGREDVAHLQHADRLN